MTDNLKGKLLLAGGALFDDNFRQTVVLIGGHDDSGAFGLVLNRPLDTTIAEAVPPLAALAGAEARLFRGGPVAPELPVLLVRVSDPAGLDVPILGSTGLVTGDVSTELGRRVVEARVFAGHAGWAPGQLEAELEADAWIVEAATEADVFSAEPETLWRRLLERKGPDFARLARVPFDPSLN